MNKIYSHLSTVLAREFFHLRVLGAVVLHNVVFCYGCPISLWMTKQTDNSIYPWKFLKTFFRLPAFLVLGPDMNKSYPPHSVQWIMLTSLYLPFWIISIILFFIIIIFFFIIFPSLVSNNLLKNKNLKTTIFKNTILDLNKIYSLHFENE